MKDLNAVVIGSGIGGMATAIRLAARGIKVQVFEANDYPGGKLTTLTQDGFRFDAGPSLFTLPELVDELFILSGRDPQKHFRYRPVDPLCQYFYEDGTLIKAHADKKLLKEEIDHQLGGHGEKVIQYLAKSARAYDLTAGIFLKKSLHKFGNYLSSSVLKSLVRIHTLNLTTTMNRVNEKSLQHEKLIQLFNRYATYNGSSPYLAPGVLCMIPHLEFNLGTYFPEKGMHDIILSLVKLAESLNVKIHYNSTVDKILIQNRKIAGIEVDAKKTEADIVISNMDVVPTYRKLLPELKAPQRVMEQERSSSALIFYWGMDRQFPELDLHNIFFTENYKAEFNAIFNEYTLHDDPTVYVNISSKYVPEDAPPGKENWFVMINTPCNTGQDWNKLIGISRQRIIKKLSGILGVNIEPYILNESILDPLTIETKTSSFRGSLYGSSSNHWISAFNRHPNFHSKVRGLYFCGGSVHPGGGIPLSILSAKIVDNLIHSDHED